MRVVRAWLSSAPRALVAQRSAEHVDLSFTPSDSEDTPVLRAELSNRRRGDRLQTTMTELTIPLSASV